MNHWLSHLPDNTWLFLKATCQVSQDFLFSVTWGQWLGLFLFVLCGLGHWRGGQKKTKDPHVFYLKRNSSREKASRLTFNEQVHVLTYEKSGRQVSPRSGFIFEWRTFRQVNKFGNPFFFFNQQHALLPTPLLSKVTGSIHN